MKDEENNFIIKMGIVPERINTVGYFIDKGKQYPLVYGLFNIVYGFMVKNDVFSSRP